MNRYIKVKSHKRIVWDNKRKRVIKKRGIRVKKSHIILTALLISSLIIIWQGYKLNTEIKPQIEITATKKQKKENTKSAENPSKEFKPKTNYKENETETYNAVEAACKYHGMDTKQCRNDLMGIAYAEHRDFGNGIGDSTQSYGRFQIHLGYHPEITKEEAEDVYFAAKWTLRRLIYNGYKTNRDIAIMKHNGTPNIEATKSYLKTVNQYIAM